MASPFLCVDVSDRSRDFEFVVLDAGVRLLDPRGAHYQMLRKWLKGQVAEPELKGQQVRFYLRSDLGGRLEGIRCTPVTDADLEKPLRKEFEKLVAAVQTATAMSPDEEAVLRVAREELLSLTTQRKKSQRGFSLFKYQDASRTWRLAWCVGYRRKDPDPSAPQICENENCLHLSVRRSNDPDCPVCRAPVVRSPRPRDEGVAPDAAPRRSRLWPTALAGLTLLVAVAGLGWWYLNQNAGGGKIPPQSPGLVVSPATWTGPVGSRIDFVVMQVGPEGERDATRVAVPQVSDPKVVALDNFGLQAHARAIGKAVIEFRVGALSQQVTVVVQPDVPERVTLEPKSLILGLGTTAQLKLIGEYADQRRVDLTDAAEWVPAGDRVVFAYRGLLEGLTEGEVTLRVRFRPSPQASPLETTAQVSVRRKEYTSLTLRLDPLSIAVNQAADIAVEVKPDEGPPLSVSESSLLSLSLDPPDAGTIEGRRVYAKRPGPLKITGRFLSLADTVGLEVVNDLPPESDKLDVQPRTLELAVGEIASLSIRAPKLDPPLRIVSAVPGTVHVTDDRRLVGRAEGTTRIEVIQGTEIIPVEVTVKSVSPESISFAPVETTVRVDDAAGLRVVATVDSHRTFDVAPEALDWIGIPRPDYASLDKSNLRVRGLKPTGEDQEVLAVRFGGREARAGLQVISAPLRLELTPTGPLQIFLGQKVPLRVWATYGDGRRQEIAADRVEWNWSPAPGLLLEDGTLQAQQADVGPLTIAAAYQGVSSNGVEVQTVAAAPNLTLALTARPESLAVGETGSVELSGSLDSKPVSIAEAGWTFDSSDSEVLQVAPETGQFRASRAGQAKITAKSPSGETAEAEVTVLPPVSKPEPPRIQTVRIVSDQSLPVRIPVGAEFSDYRVEAVDEKGVARDVTAESTGDLVFDGDPAEIPLLLRDGKLFAAHPGEIQFTASFSGIEAEEPLPIVVVDELQIDEIRVSPDVVRLAVGESVELAAEGFWMGKSVGQIANHPRLVWKSRAGEDVVQVTGSQIMGAKPGEAGVTAQFDAIVSSVTQFTVVGNVDDIADRLRVSPDALQLQVGDARTVGAHIRLTRGNVDFGSQVEVSPASPQVVNYDPEQQTLTAIGPGRSLVTYAAGGQLVHQIVDVAEAEVPSAGSRVEIEPRGGLLAVGERLNLRGFQICDSCATVQAGRTSSLALTSSDPSICAVDGATLIGLQPGSVEISARLPGIDAPSVETFTVVDVAFDRLVIVPPHIQLQVGGQSQFQVYALTPSGRRAMGDHPDLVLALEGPESASVRLDAASRSVSAISPGRVKLVARWRDTASAQSQLVVNGEPVRAIRLSPDDATVVMGETQTFQAFVQRGANWMPLTAGVSFRSTNPSVARVERDLQVETVQAGVVRMVAHYGSRRAEARLTVSPKPSPGAPAGPAVALQFIPNLFRIEMGTPGDSIRVVRVHADGRQEDVDHLAAITIRDPQDVISIEQTASGPVVRPQRIGQTQLDATLDDLRTPSPLLIDVVAAVPRTARVRVQPSPMRLRLGETGPIAAVEVVPARGGRPFSPNYRLSASPSPVIEADDVRKSIRGLKAGNAVATVTVLDPNGGFDGLSADIPVEVVDPNAAEPPSAPGAPSKVVSAQRLTLDGPAETTVDAEIQLQAETQEGDATAEAQLTLPAAERELAEIRPGCKIVARKPGTIHVQARAGDLVSNIHEVRIAPAATSYERLALVLDSKPLAVNEVRGYELWGYPRGGKPREDLLGRISDDPADETRPRVEVTVLAPSTDVEVVRHQSPKLAAVAAGKVRVQAILGKLQSNLVEISVSAESANEPIQVRIEPSKAVLREGEPSPEFRVLVRSKGSTTFREVDNARLESGDMSVLAPLAGDPRRFTAAKAGTTSVRAVFGELHDTAEIQVVADRFRTIHAGKLALRSQSFDLQLEVRSSASSEKVEYRVTVPETRDASAWATAEAKGDEMSALLSTPSIPLGPNSQVYRLILEARTVGSSSVERYPYSFQIKSDVVERKD